jgi:hypothetical protein
MVEAALTGEAIVKIVGAMISEISRNSSRLPRFKVDVEQEFHDTKNFERLCVDLSPTLRVRFIFSPAY